MWAWVPYEDDPSQGKDRPVLVPGGGGDGWTGLMLSSQDHDRDAADEARWGRYWMDVGTGGWDSQRRPSEVRLDRRIPLERDAVRREGAALDPSSSPRWSQRRGVPVAVVGRGAHRPLGLRPL